MTVGDLCEQAVCGVHRVAQAAGRAPTLLDGLEHLGQAQTVLPAGAAGRLQPAQQLGLSGASLNAHPSIIAPTDELGEDPVTSMIDLHGLDVPLPEPTAEAVEQRAGEILADAPRPMGVGEARTLALGQLRAELVARTAGRLPVDD